MSIDTLSSPDNTNIEIPDMNFSLEFQDDQKNIESTSDILGNILHIYSLQNKLFEGSSLSQTEKNMFIE